MTEKQPNQTTEQQKRKNFIEDLLYLIKNHPVPVGLLLLASVFYGGFSYAKLLHEWSGNVILSKNTYETKEMQYISQEKTDDKLTTENKKLTEENKSLKQCEGQISGMSAVSQPPSGGHHLLGNRIVMGNITPCREKRLWLVVSLISPDEAGTSIVYDKDCYVQGEIIPQVNKKTDKYKLEFQTATTSIAEAKSYKIYFLAVGDKPTNNLLIQAQGKNPPHILCSFVNLYKNQVAMETFDNK